MARGASLSNGVTRMPGLLIWNNIIRMTKDKEYFVTRPVQRPPTHPGTMIKEDLFPRIKMSTTEVAAVLGISRQQLHRILAGTQSVNAPIALKLGKLTGVSADLLMNMQQAFDLWTARIELADELASISPSVARDDESAYKKSVSAKRRRGPKRLPDRKSDS